MDMSREIPPPDVRALFRPLHAALIELLRGLADDEWQRETGAGSWTVRDVCAHLLDGDLRRISIDRDNHAPPPPSSPIGGYPDLLRYLNDLNAEWISAMQRVSARMIVDLLASTGAVTASLMEAGTLEGAATWAVAWAGQQQSPMWLDIGREYTERWHHQDQIRAATGREAVPDPRLVRPVIEVSLFAVPHVLNAIDVADGTSISVTATGGAGGEWSLDREHGVWRIREGTAAAPAATITATGLNVARMLMHRLTAQEVATLVQVDGDPRLTDAVIRARAVMV